MKRYTTGQDGVPHARTTVRIYGERQIAIWEAMCAASGRRPHELAADIILGAIQAREHDHGIQHLAQIIRAQPPRRMTEPNGRAWRLGLRYRDGAGDEVTL
jgi:hypothetical protein